MINVLRNAWGGVIAECVTPTISFLKGNKMRKSLQARLDAIQYNRYVMGAGMLMASGLAAAAEGDIDVTSHIATIGKGVLAVAALGAAFLGVTVLKKLWGKLGG